MPLRGMVLLTGGKALNFMMMEGLIDIANGRIFQGMNKLKKGKKIL